MCVCVFLVWSDQLKNVQNFSSSLSSFLILLPNFDDTTWPSMCVWLCLLRQQQQQRQLKKMKVRTQFNHFAVWLIGGFWWAARSNWEGIEARWSPLTSLLSKDCKRLRRTQEKWRKMKLDWNLLVCVCVDFVESRRSGRRQVIDHCLLSRMSDIDAVVAAAVFWLFLLLLLLFQKTVAKDRMRKQRKTTRQCCFADLSHAKTLKPTSKSNYRTLLKNR